MAGAAFFQGQEQILGQNMDVIVGLEQSLLVQHKAHVVHIVEQNLTVLLPLKLFR